MCMSRKQMLQHSTFVHIGLKQCQVGRHTRGGYVERRHDRRAIGYKSQVLLQPTALLGSEAAVIVLTTVMTSVEDIIQHHVVDSTYIKGIIGRTINSRELIICHRVLFRSGPLVSSRALVVMVTYDHKIRESHCLEVPFLDGEGIIPIPYDIAYAYTIEFRTSRIIGFECEHILHCLSPETMVVVSIEHLRVGENE